MLKALYHQSYNANWQIPQIIYSFILVLRSSSCLLFFVSLSPSPSPSLPLSLSSSLPLFLSPSLPLSLSPPFPLSLHLSLPLSFSEVVDSPREWTVVSARDMCDR